MADCVIQYMKIEQSIRANGDRHFNNAYYYALCGYPKSYFDGAMRKAEKNYKKADRLKIDPILEAIFKPMVDNLMNRINGSIMNG